MDISIWDTLVKVGPVALLMVVVLGLMVFTEWAFTVCKILNKKAEETPQEKYKQPNVENSPQNSQNKRGRNKTPLTARMVSFVRTETAAGREVTVRQVARRYRISQDKVYGLVGGIEELCLIGGSGLHPGDVLVCMRQVG